MQNKNLEPVNYYVGIDVGTASVRAALVDQFGTVVAYADQPIQIWAPQPDHYEQSSDDIWAACCTVTKKVIQGIDIGKIRGLGFDATCSLVVLDNHFQPLAINSEGKCNRNIIMWMDHRAAIQAARISGTQHNVLRYVGGVMSAEMQPPKLLWIKELGTRHIVQSMQAAGHHVNTLFMCGGLSKNPLFVQMHADVTGMPVVLAQEVESVLMGAAILGACASKDFASLQDAMKKMGRVGRVVMPNHKDKRYYDKKYQVFQKLVEHQQEYKAIMQSV